MNSFKGIDVNPALSSLHGRLLDITLTVPLISTPLHLAY